jgi:hypothetical protein
LQIANYFSIKPTSADFDMDTVAIMGHNISEGAAITMQANDFNEWNYTDGSGSSIIQHALTWDDETILKMITAKKKQYVKFTINDPNNDDAKTEDRPVLARPLSRYRSREPGQFHRQKEAHRRCNNGRQYAEVRRGGNEVPRIRSQVPADVQYDGNGDSNNVRSRRES